MLLSTRRLRLPPRPSGGEPAVLAKPLCQTHIFLMLDDNDRGTSATSRRPAPRAAAQQGERKW